MINPKRAGAFLHPLVIHSRFHDTSSSGANFILYSFLRCDDQAILVPLRATAVLPAGCAEVAEFGSAPASHVVTSHVELNKRVASWAGLPALSTSQRPKLDGCGVDSAIFLRMGSLLAFRARGQGACWTDDSSAGEPFSGAKKSRASRLVAVYAVLREHAELGVLSLKFRTQFTGDEGEYGRDSDYLLTATKRVK